MTTVTIAATASASDQERWHKFKLEEEAQGHMIRRLQSDTRAWVVEALGYEVLANKRERLLRFLEEALEYVVAAGLHPTDIHAMMEYVRQKEHGRPQDPKAEAGDVMFTLMASCDCQGIDLQDTIIETMLSAWGRIPQIREKQKAKVAYGGITG